MFTVIEKGLNGWELRNYNTHWAIVKPMGGGVTEAKNAVFAVGTQSHVERKWKRMQKLLKK